MSSSDIYSRYTFYVQYIIAYRFFQTLSIIGSRQVFELEFISMRARDLFAERLFYFVLENIISNKPQHRQQLQQRDRSLAVQRQLRHPDLEDEGALGGINMEVEHKRDTPNSNIFPLSPPPPPIEVTGDTSESKDDRRQNYFTPLPSMS